MSLASAWCLVKLFFAVWASVLTAIGLIETINKQQL